MSGSLPDDVVGGRAVGGVSDADFVAWLRDGPGAELEWTPSGARGVVRDLIRIIDDREASLASGVAAIQPSAELKAAMVGEFTMRVDHAREDCEYHIPWSVIKRVLRAVRARVASAVDERALPFGWESDRDVRGRLVMRDLWLRSLDARVRKLRGVGELPETPCKAAIVAINRLELALVKAGVLEEVT